MNFTRFVYAFAAPELVVHHAGDAIGEGVGFEIVVQGVVAIWAVEADLEIVLLAAMLHQERTNFMAEVALHFKKRVRLHADSHRQRDWRESVRRRAYMQQVVLPEPIAPEIAIPV